MKEYFPAYFPRFACLASACPDSCCHLWEVDIDPETAGRYRSLPGDLGDKLRRVLRDAEGSTYMTIENGRCPMWQADGLCEIQCNLGHDALSKTCREYPRIHHDYGDFTEWGLELSCPAAAELILRSPEQDILTRTSPHREEGDYDRQWMAILLESREQLLTFWENRPYSLPRMLAVSLLYAHQVQSALDGGALGPFQPEALLQRGISLAKPGQIQDLFAFFRSLEILTPQWEQRLSPLSQAVWHTETANFVRYLLLRYYLQAVSDGDIVCRIKWVITACLLLAYMDGDFVENAQLLSKEIENDYDNMDAILDGAYTAPAFADLPLLGLLLL